MRSGTFRLSATLSAAGQLRAARDLSFRLYLKMMRFCPDHFAKVEVAGSSPVSRSISPDQSTGYWIRRTKTPGTDKNPDKNSELPAQHRFVEHHLDLAVRQQVLRLVRDGGGFVAVRHRRLDLLDLIARILRQLREQRANLVE